MPRKPTKPDDSEQSKRFIETAEQVEADKEDVVGDTLTKSLQKKNSPSKQSRRAAGQHQES
jgi:hypothetical protein